MLSDREIAAFLEEQLAPDDLEQVKLRFAKDSDALATLLQQQKMDGALRVYFSGEADEQKLRDEILAALDCAREDATTVHENSLTADSAQTPPNARSRFPRSWKSTMRIGITICALAVVAGLYLATQRREIKAQANHSSISENAHLPNEERGWFWRPFARESPWNQPLTASAICVPLSFGNSVVLGVAARRFVVSESNRAKVRSFFSKEKVWKNLRIPASVDLSKFDDEPLCVVDLARKKVWTLQTLGAHGDQVSAERMSTESLRGSGFDWPKGADAPRSCSAMGGVIRGNELSAGIHHALAVSVDFKTLRVENKTGDEPEKLRIGSRIAIPRNVNLRALGLNAGSPKIARIAKALQTYGAYVVSGCGGSQMKFYFDQTVDLPPGLNRALTRLIVQVEMVAPSPREVGH